MIELVTNARGHPRALSFFLIDSANCPLILILTYIALAQNFGKGGGFAAGLILLPVIFIPILAFGDAQYQGAPPPLAA